ncbi:MAG: M48 family metalloprotease [Geobacter sp.]|nr:M48 family metalloprotease [Geobacter sp.]
MIRRLLFSSAAILCLLAGCADLGVRIPGMTPEQSDMITKSVSAAAKAARPVSESEEYYVGRAVAARLIGTYPLLKSRELTDYVNAVGQTVALYSDMPNTYGGYHFAILDSDEVNAFACPGGIIFITRGMLNAVQNEDELAAVLAHEVAHVNHRDGISAITKARWTEAVTIIGTEAAKAYGPRELAQLVSIFEGSIDDVFKTLVVNGYGRSQEHAADRTALDFLARAGYDPRALHNFVNRIMEEGKETGGLLKTHPATSARVEQIREALPEAAIDPTLVQRRSKRFSAAVRR